MSDEPVAVEEAIARIDAAQLRVETAARALSDDEFAVAGGATLRTYAGETQSVAQQILYVALSGELPTDGQAVAIPGGRDEVLASVRDGLDSLYVHVREADPDEFLDCTWRHPGLGEMNWRQWLVSLADDANRCADRLEALKHA